MKSPLVLESDRLRISFQRDSSDRFGHTIELIDGGGRAYPVLESIEGTADEPWPASPPFQEAHLEQRAGGRQVVLLVGMAGSSHWSASAEIDPQSHSVAFDIACRLRGRSDWLGSRYEIHGAGLAIPDGRIRLTTDPSTELLGQRPLARWLELATNGDPAGLILEGSELRIAAETVESQAAHTIRWRYAISAAFAG